MPHLRRHPRVVSVSAASVLALTAAACGGSAGGAGSAGAKGAGAAAAPASTILFVDADIDAGSGQWQRATALGSRFPSWPKLIARFQQAVTDGHGPISFERDVRPWLGGEASVAVTGVRVGSGEGGPKPDYVAYAASRDDGKLRAALERAGFRAAGSYAGYGEYTTRAGGEALHAAVGDGALLLGSTQALLHRSIDVREGRGAALADSAAFKKATERLPDESLALGYVDGAGLRQVLRLASAAQSGMSTPRVDTQLQGVDGIAFSLSAQDRGLDARAVVLAEKGALARLGVGPAFRPSLAGRVPANAVAYLGFSDLGPKLQRLLAQGGASNAEVASAPARLQALTGISFTKDLVPLLSGEHAVYARPGQHVAASLLLRPADVDRGVATLQKATAALARFQPQLRPTPIPGVQGQQVTVGGQTLSWRRTGDALAIGNDPGVGEDQGGGLAATDRFGQAAKDAGLPDEVTGVLFADVQGLVSLVSGTDDDGKISPEARRNLEHVGGVLGWSALDGDVLESRLFVQIG